MQDIHFTGRDRSRSHHTAALVRDGEGEYTSIGSERIKHSHRDQSDGRSAEKSEIAGGSAGGIDARSCGMCQCENMHVLKRSHEAQGHRTTQMTRFQPSAVHLSFEVALHAIPSPIILAPQLSYTSAAAYLKHEKTAGGS